MRLPFLIFFISGIAAMQLEPVMNRVLSVITTTAYAHSSIAGDARIASLQQELESVQMELMQVLQTDPATTSVLQEREQKLKYALRAARIRRDEMLQCQAQKRRPGTQLASRCVIGS